MAVANALRYVQKVVVGVEVGALDVAVTPFARSQHGDGPTILHQSGRKAKSYIVHHVVALKDNCNKRLTLSNLETICAECHNEEHPEKAANYNNKQKYKRRQKKRDSAGVFKFKAGATF